MNAHKDVESMVRETLVAAKYRDVERTLQDILEVIAQYPGLEPVGDNYIFNDGSEQPLLKLSGTLPVNYKGNAYNIPIELWLLNTYPYNAPLVHVAPTFDMRIKISENVMVDGRVKLPYLQEWNHNSSELLLLIQVLIITFQDRPPVYSVQFSSPQPLSPPFNSPFNNPDQNFVAPNLSPPVVLSPERLDLLQNTAEKILRRLHHVYTSTCLEQRNSDRLRAGSEHLTALINQLDAEKLRLQDTIDKCQEEIEESSAKLLTYEAEVGDREANIEDAIVAPRPLYKQIVEANAEEAAIQDAIYFVNEGFRVGRMELDQFEKTIRKLARKQFMLRLLLAQCREKAGL